MLGGAENGALATLFLNPRITIVYYRPCKGRQDGCRINSIASIATHPRLWSIYGIVVWELALIKIPWKISRSFIGGQRLMLASGMRKELHMYRGG